MFRGLNFWEDKFSWVRVSHCNYCCWFLCVQIFVGLIFVSVAYPRKLAPRENVSVYGEKCSGYKIWTFLYTLSRVERRLHAWCYWYAIEIPYFLKCLCNRNTIFPQLLITFSLYLSSNSTHTSAVHQECVKCFPLNGILWHVPYIYSMHCDLVSSDFSWFTYF